ncbi:MAG: hypothetical protein PHZ00_05445 [Candidatus Peribacteraceae bacterium]|nr:hypothetical protein [Candidatus Peribacteraceae bacterium]
MLQHANGHEFTRDSEPDTQRGLTRRDAMFLGFYAVAASALRCRVERNNAVGQEPDSQPQNDDAKQRQMTP